MDILEKMYFRRLIDSVWLKKFKQTIQNDGSFTKQSNALREELQSKYRPFREDTEDGRGLRTNIKKTIEDKATAKDITIEAFAAFLYDRKVEDADDWKEMTVPERPDWLRFKAENKEAITDELRRLAAKHELLLEGRQIIRVKENGTEENPSREITAESAAEKFKAALSGQDKSFQWAVPILRVLVVLTDSPERKDALADLIETANTQGVEVDYFFADAENTQVPAGKLTRADGLVFFVDETLLAFSECTDRLIEWLTENEKQPACYTDYDDTDAGHTLREFGITRFAADNTEFAVSILLQQAIKRTDYFEENYAQTQAELRHTRAALSNLQDKAKVQDSLRQQAVQSASTSEKKLKQAATEAQQIQDRLDYQQNWTKKQNVFLFGLVLLLLASLGLLPWVFAQKSRTESLKEAAENKKATLYSEHYLKGKKTVLAGLFAVNPAEIEVNLWRKRADDKLLQFAKTNYNRDDLKWHLIEPTDYYQTVCGCAYDFEKNFYLAIKQAETCEKGTFKNKLTERCIYKIESVGFQGNSTHCGFKDLQEKMNDTADRNFFFCKAHRSGSEKITMCVDFSVEMSRKDSIKVILKNQRRDIDNFLKEIMQQTEVDDFNPPTD